jgi:hypothetical protein
MTTGFGELDRIRDEVPHDLTNATLLSEIGHVCGGARDRIRDRHTAGDCLRFDLSERLLNRRAEAPLGPRDRQRSCVGARDREHVVHDLQEMATVSFQSLDMGLLAFTPAGFLFQQGGVPHHRVQWRAELVTDARHKNLLTVYLFQDVLRFRCRLGLLRQRGFDCPPSGKIPRDFRKADQPPLNVA